MTYLILILLDLEGRLFPQLVRLVNCLLLLNLESSEAYKLQLIGGNDKQISPAIHNEGTKVEVRDLFFATPARLKFLRTDKTEFAASLDIIKKITLAHPHISFNMSHDGKSVIKGTRPNRRIRTCP